MGRPGLVVAALGVEDANPGTPPLPAAQVPDGPTPARTWEHEDEDGVLRMYETTLTILRKRP